VKRKKREHAVNELSRPTVTKKLAWCI